MISASTALEINIVHFYASAKYPTQKHLWKRMLMSSIFDSVGHYREIVFSSLIKGFNTLH